MTKKNKISYKPRHGLKTGISGYGMVGLQGIVFSSETTIPVTNSTTTTMSVDLPAKALILDVGLVTLTAIDAASSSEIDLSFGTTSGGAELIAAVQINNTNDDIAAGTSISSLQNNIAHTSGNAVGVFKQGAALYSADNRRVFGNVIIAGAELDGAGAVRIFVKYTIVEDTY